MRMDGCSRGSETRTSSETSALIADESTELPPQDLQVAESTPTEWTDEKHSLYLKSMEASFVDQLYNSADLLGWRLQKEMSEDQKLSRLVHCNARAPSGQFKVLRHGCWRKINFRNHRSQPDVANECYELLRSPWIKHFRSSRNPRAVASASLQESTASQGQWINLNGKKAILSGSGAFSRNSHKCHPRTYWHDLIDVNTEVSDQNFEDEDIEGEKASNGCCSN